MNASYITPAITLLKEDGSLDLDSQKSLYEHLIRCRMDGILVQGSMGEFSAMPMFQRMQHAKFSIEAINRRTKCIVGTSSMLTDEIAPYSNVCLDMGADAVMIVSPYYFRLDDAALFRFYDQMLYQIHGPVYVYNLPSSTGHSIAPETILKLRQKHENLIGVKDTVSSMEHTREIIKTVKAAYPEFEVYSGFDDNAAHTVLSGGNGCIGGLSNAVPEICTAWVQAMRDNDVAGMALGQQRIDRLMDLYSMAPLFVPMIKECVKLREIVSSDICSFPMPAPTDEQCAALVCILEREGIVLPSRNNTAAVK
ncbi:MAG: dihydrodipicolinate synthase family protein [Eubacteriales bacterium]|nr:dihydrodipicolinate synthase family protein [Eubacteriales bacterium]